MSSGVSRIAFVGPLGSELTTALQTLCGSVRSTADASRLGRSPQGEALTSGRIEFGEIDLGGGQRLQLCGCQGTQHLDFVSRWVLSVSVGAFIMVDVTAPDGAERARALLAEVTAHSCTAIALVLSARPATPAQREAFGAALAAGGGVIVPILQVDPANRLQLLDALGVLASLLALQQEAPPAR
ncbi:GTPase [Acidovorax sp. FG27]|uniref:GTPase n=1 Tax=Acidovorax sp. FG27 TaxID=3133652 RepID=UPI0030EA209E